MRGYFEVRTRGELRFETLSEEQAVAYAQDLVRQDKSVLPDIFHLDRAPVAHAPFTPR